MGSDHGFIKEMENLGITNYFENEYYFLFEELKAGEDMATRKASIETDDILINGSGEIEMEIYLEAGHSDLLDRYPYLIDQSIVLFDIHVLERFP